MSDSLKQQYPPFATDPETPWPTTDGKRAMPRLAASGGGEVAREHAAAHRVTDGD